MTPFRKGRLIETIACIFLTLKGYHILHRRFKSRGGEIDILAVGPHNTLSVVEVKYRSTLKSALDSVTPFQRQRIQQCLNFFLSFNPKYHTYTIRYDVIVVSPFRMRHIKQAWTEGWM